MMIMVIQGYLYSSLISRSMAWLRLPLGNVSLGCQSWLPEEHLCNKCYLPVAPPEGWALLFAEVRTRLQELHSPWPVAELGSQWAHGERALGDILGNEGWTQLTFACAPCHWTW